MKFFIYTWGISPDTSKLIGPFDTLDAAKEWGSDNPDERPEQAAIVELPFHEVAEWIDAEQV
jgi:hypothetical protein